MKRKHKFSQKILNSIDKNNSIYIRAGAGPHRFIRIWAVVVEDRVFIRSWSLKARSWYRTFLADPKGALQIDDLEIYIRAGQTRSKRLLDAVDRAYLHKYHTKGSIKYAKDLCRPKSRATTTELSPI
jgi:hypothetical protein